MRPLMVQGASSWAGKSLLTTALARAFRRRGIDVVPFKAVNMSNNARVAGGGELGAAQYLQALAAGVEPDVRMNPVLIKPEADTRSEVVVLGRADRELSRLPWRERTARLKPIIAQALAALQAEHELVLIEGAGSPTEINLRDSDLANMHTAALAGAEVLLVADIDRGGAFAHLYGTWALLPDRERRLVRGFVLNKLRGDERLLAPGPERLEQLTGVPTLGVLPWLAHGLPDEDGVAAPREPAGEGAPVVAVISYPTASNLDEFKALERHVRVRWATRAAELDDAAMIILPGSKHVEADLRWLLGSDLPQALAGRPLLGICGGMQMLGEDVQGQPGLGLLPLSTTFAEEKLTARTNTRFGALPAPWSALSHQGLDGYEIRRGLTRPTAPVEEALPGGLGYVRGEVLGIYVHGLFEQPRTLGALFGAAADQDLETAFEELADMVQARIDLDGLLAGVA
jgi:adenosylcobyric acid synthase